MIPKLKSLFENIILAQDLFSREGEWEIDEEQQIKDFWFSEGGWEIDDEEQQIKDFQSE